MATTIARCRDRIEHADGALKASRLFLVFDLSLGAYAWGRFMAWQAIWNEGHEIRRPRAVDTGAIQGLTLQLEIALPVRPAVARPMRIWDGTSDRDHAISIYVMPDGAVRLIHGAVDVATPTDTVSDRETVGLTYTACALGRRGGLEVVNFDRHTRHRVLTRQAQPLAYDDAAPRDPAFLQVVHVAAIATSILEGRDLPGLESGAIVETDEGPRPVDALCPGDVLQDCDGGLHVLRGIEMRERLCLGRTAPIRLRAPYFGLARDAVVTPCTRLLQTGPVVEYLFGLEAVLVTAADLTYGPLAVRDR